MSNKLSVTELDFDKIKTNLVRYMQTQDQFNDYNYEGSGLNVLLDLLAYNTHYNAMTTHFAVNENFLSSAQLRQNVVGRAATLGYIPRSAVGSSARVTIHVPVPDVETPPSTIELARGTKIKTTIDGIVYQFVVLETSSAPLDTMADTGDQHYMFYDVLIKQGVMKKISFRADNDDENQQFVIPDQDVDMSTLRVKVKPHSEATASTVFTPFSSFANIDPAANFYFIQETSSNQYSIYFGDDIVSYKPKTNSVIDVEYITTKGFSGNGGRSFELLDNVNGMSNGYIELGPGVVMSSGGSDRESIESIRFNAPLTFTSQNRAVTAEDYKSILLKEYGDIEAITTWGGEDNIVPDYGKIYVAIKPRSAEVLDAGGITAIKFILAGKNVVSIQPEFVNPDYTYVGLDVYFKYNPNLTENTTVELQTEVKRVIEQYSLENLRDFNGVFRYSKLLREIDNADPGILNSSMHVKIFKPISLTAGSPQLNAFELEFASTLHNRPGQPVINSTPFKVNGVDHWLGDTERKGEDTPVRTINMYKRVGGNNVIVNKDVGSVNSSNGSVTLHSIDLDIDTEIKVISYPSTYDIAPMRNQILLIDSASIIVSGSIDTIAASGSAGAINYDSVERQ